MKSYTGMTAHYITNDWKLMSVLLCCNRFRGRHTGENIYQEYENVVRQFGIDQKVNHVVTDTARNMIKAFKLPGYTEDEDEDDEEEEDCDHGQGGEELNIEAETNFPTEHHGCFAHVLQLVVKDGFKVAKQIDNIIKKCSKIVSHIRKSTVATEALENEKALQLANATRWNSQLKMVRSILAIPPSKLDSVEAPLLTPYERNIMQDLVEILAPFEEATDFVQVENFPSAGYVIPCIRGLKHQLSTMASRSHTSLINALTASLDSRMAVYEEKEEYLLAAVLDCRFKLRWCKDDSEITRLKTMLTEKISIIIITEEPVANRSDITEVASIQEPPKKKRLFSFMKDDQGPESTQANPLCEIKRYLEEPCEEEAVNPLTYWKEHQLTFPKLAEVSKSLLGIPASSAPVERLFSVAGKVFRPERCRLKDTTFQKLMFLKCNKGLKKYNS
jgi:hypothetical protein